MSIEKIGKKINQFRLFILLFIIISVGLISFGLGRISVQNSPQTSLLAASGAQNAEYKDQPISYPENYQELLKTPIDDPNNSLFVASRNGSKYYPKNCASAGRISENNRVFFASEAEAKLAGFERTKQCKF